MEIKMYSEGDPLISNIKTHVEEDKITLNFMWSNHLEQVYVYRRNLLQEEQFNWDKPYRKYTKDEYIRFGGFVDISAELGILEYSICPFIKEDTNAYIIQYEEPCNRVEVSTRRIQIKYTLKEKRKLFGSTKNVQMHVFCDTQLPRELLCYTKKKGSIPLDAQDGTQFKFITDFAAGDNVLPEIEMDKDEYIRIYLAENIEHKELYKVYKV